MFKQPLLTRHLIRLGALLMPLALSAYSTTASAQTLLSQGKPVTASSQEGDWLRAANAVDGLTGTRWGSSFAEGQ